MGSSGSSGSDAEEEAIKGTGDCRPIAPGAACFSMFLDDKGTRGMAAVCGSKMQQ